jgi:spore maturation protein SpmA
MFFCCAEKQIDAPNSCPIPNYRFTLMPVTIKMIRDGLAGDLTDGLLINNTIISTVSVVCLVRFLLILVRIFYYYMKKFGKQMCYFVK